MRRAHPGSFRSLAGQLLQIYGLRLAIWVPLGAAAFVAVLTGVLAPSGLENDATHANWSQLFATAAQVIGALLVALVVEVRTPFTRSGELAIRMAAVSAGVMLVAAAAAAIVALSPMLSDGLYLALLVVTLAGAAGGLVSVVMLGISTVLGTLRSVDEESLDRLANTGDPRAIEERLQRRGRL